MSDATGVAASQVGKGSPKKSDPTYAWAIALLPLAGIPFVLMADPWGWVAAGVVAVLTVVLAFADARQVDKAGVVIGAGVAIFGGIWYLIARTRHAGSTPALPVVWVVSAAAWGRSLLLAGPLGLRLREHRDGDRGLGPRQRHVPRGRLPSHRGQRRRLGVL